MKPQRYKSRKLQILFFLISTLLVAINFQVTSAEPISPQCLSTWGFSGIYPGMRKSEFRAVFPDAEMLKRPWHEKTFRVLVENPIEGINTGPGEMTVFVENGRVSAIRFEPDRTSLDALLEQLEDIWGEPNQGVSCGGIVTFHSEESSGELESDWTHTSTLSWPNECGIDASLYLREIPSFWVVEN